MDQSILEQFQKYRKQIDIGKIRETHIHYCTPCYGGLVTEPFFRSWSKAHMMYTKYDIPYSVTTSANESLVSRARCHMVAYMMANPKATHLMFIDADINFDCIDILHMLQHDKDIIVGAYPKKDLNWNMIKMGSIANEDITVDELKSLGANYALNFDWAHDKDNKPVLKVDNGLVKLKDAATGFMLIKREVIEKMIEAYPELYFNNDLNLDKEFEKWTYLFFDCMHEPESKRYLSEDYAFCRRWQAIGGEVWLDPLVSLDHVGHFTFNGNVGALLR
jgi:hypothetical protein